ncbi:hypothetical protein ColLi_13426 [Colletotrichum liriopes]|uniref:Uncharacterized protein n=1 Tax=Colletotrichum liriopes TaxID=708192 RepID=A0AA37H072_9PEZI|nr:hypothetical protein ColLi_13426 [Colletotrichum liriopes]
MARHRQTRPEIESRYERAHSSRALVIRSQHHRPRDPLPARSKLGEQVWGSAGDPDLGSDEDPDKQDAKRKLLTDVLASVRGFWMGVFRAVRMTWSSGLTVCGWASQLCFPPWISWLLCTTVLIAITVAFSTWLGARLMINTWQSIQSFLVSLIHHPMESVTSIWEARALYYYTGGNAVAAAAAAAAVTDSTGNATATGLDGLTPTTTGLIAGIGDFQNTLYYLKRVPVDSDDHFGAVIVQGMLTMTGEEGASMSGWTQTWTEIDACANLMEQHDKNYVQKTVQQVQQDHRRSHSLLVSMGSRPAAKADAQMPWWRKRAVSLGLGGFDAKPGRTVALARINEFDEVLKEALAARDWMGHVARRVPEEAARPVKDSLCTLKGIFGSAVRVGDERLARWERAEEEEEKRKKTGAAGVAGVAGANGGEVGGNGMEVMRLGDAVTDLRTWHRASAQACEMSQMVISSLDERRAVAINQEREFLMGIQIGTQVLLEQTRKDTNANVAQVEAELAKIIESFLACMRTLYWAL